MGRARRRRAVWFTARSSSTDVAALALGVARSATSIVDGVRCPAASALRALPAPAENVETLAEILGEDLAEWPAERVARHRRLPRGRARSRAPRTSSQTLVAVSPVQFLIASRVRPAWISTKELMYGDAFEVNQTTLAMDNREAADVLVGRSARSTTGLVLLANGWPAVIGLASVSSAEIEDDLDQVPESLYRFFADEVFGALGAEVRQGLTTLAVAPVLDHELAAALLGSRHRRAGLLGGTRRRAPRRAWTAPRPASARSGIPRGAERATRSRAGRRGGVDLPGHVSQSSRVGCGV